mgnify:CR=1 FL=1
MRETSASVPLAEVVEALEMQTEEMTFYLDRKTGRVDPVFDEAWPDADTEDEACETASDADDNDLDDFDDPAAWARAVEADVEGRFVALPSKFDIHDWEMMKRFALEVGEKEADTLHDAIRGRGAFRRFKDAVQRLGLTDAWHAFRDAEYAAIARDWAEANDVVLVEEQSGE